MPSSVIIFVWTLSEKMFAKSINEFEILNLEGLKYNVNVVCLKVA